MNKTERITIRLTSNQKETLEREAKRMGVSIGWILREMYFGDFCLTMYDKKIMRDMIPKADMIIYDNLTPPQPATSKDVVGYREVMKELVEKLAKRKKELDND